MNKSHILYAAVVVLAALAGCASPPVVMQSPDARWDGGVWNSVLGYHGPTNVLVAGAK